MINKFHKNYFRHLFSKIIYHLYDLIEILLININKKSPKKVLMFKGVVIMEKTYNNGDEQMTP